MDIPTQDGAAAAVETDEMEMDYNSNIECHLSKSLSTPRKCSYCSKIMFFKAYRCKHCRYRCHKKCANHTHKRTQSCHKQYSGEEHWTKVLQANEVNSNLLLVPCHHGRRSHTYTEKAREMTSSRSLEESLLGSSGLDGADHHHHICAKRTLSDADGRSSSPSTPCSKDDPTKDANIFTKLYAKFCQWVATNKHPGSREGSATHTPRHRSRSSSIHSNRSQDLLQLLAHMPEELDEDRGSCIHHSLSSEESELYESLKRHHYSSTCSSLTITSTSTTTSDCPGTCPELSVSKASSPKRLLSKWINTKEDCKYLEVNDHRTRHSNLTFTISCPLRTKLPSQSVPEREKVSLCATWPLVSRRRNGQDSDEFDEYEESVFDFKEQESANTSDDVQLRESLGEFSISFPDLEFKECVRVGRRREVYRGQWHGDVMIHIYKGIEEEEVARFWSEVSKLSMIRHENVALFMGACIEHPQLAVVTSVRKGVPLYDHIHLRSEKMSLHSRVNVVKQIAQAMGYLHAKGLVLCKLNSRNITLEPKVKVSLMDFGMSERKFDRPGFGCVPRGHLTYTAPEMLRTLRVESPRLTSKTAHSTQTDVYAFGTLLFELMAGRYPFRGFTAEALVYNVAKGRRQSLKDLKCNAHLKSIIEQCWSYSPDDRPAFSNINKELQHNSALHKIHSSSVPERLNRAGLHKASDFLS